MLLASDFDNTLYFDEHFRKSDLEAIRRFQKAGHLFGVSTGRPLIGITDPSGDQLHYDFYICNSGGSIYDSKKHKLFESTIDLSLIKEIYALNPVDISLVIDEKIAFLYKDKVPFDPGDHGMIISSLAELPAKVTGFSFHYPKGQLNEAHQCTLLINQRYGGFMSAFQNNEHVDVCGKDCSKGKGVAFIRHYFGLKAEEIAGIGDSFNDISLLEGCTKRFTFPYAPERLREKANDIVDSIADCIEILMK